MRFGVRESQFIVSGKMCLGECGLASGSRAGIVVSGDRASGSRVACLRKSRIGVKVSQVVPGSSRSMCHGIVMDDVWRRLLGR